LIRILYIIAAKLGCGKMKGEIILVVIEPDFVLQEKFIVRTVKYLEICEVDRRYLLDRHHLIGIKRNVISFSCGIHYIICISIDIPPQPIILFQSRNIVTTIYLLSRFIFVDMSVTDHPDISPFVYRKAFSQATRKGDVPKSVTAFIEQIKTTTIGTHPQVFGVVGRYIKYMVASQAIFFVSFIIEITQGIPQLTISNRQAIFIRCQPEHRTVLIYLPDVTVFYALRCRKFGFNQFTRHPGFGVKIIIG